MSDVTSRPTSASQVRQKLLEQLLDAVKNCQVRYGGKAELATEAEAVVTNLCRQLELTLQHGARDRDSHLGMAVFRNVRELVGGGELEGKNLWNIIKTLLNTHEQQRFMLLSNVNTDMGRSRAWIRSTLNEKSLEKYLQALLSDQTKLSLMYEEWAFIRDPERGSMVGSMAAGLSSVRFALSVDNAELNGETETLVPTLITNSLSSFLPFKPNQTQPVAAIAPEIAQETQGEENVISTAKVRAKGKKKLKPSSQVVSFDDSMSLNSPEVGEVAEEVFAAETVSATSSSSSSNPFSSLHNTTGNLTSRVRGESLNSDRQQRLSQGQHNSSGLEVPGKHTASSSSLVSCGSDLSAEKPNTSAYDSVSLDSGQRDPDPEEIDIYNLHLTNTTKPEQGKNGLNEERVRYSEALTPVTNKDVGALFPVGRGAGGGGGGGEVPDSSCDSTSRLSSDLETDSQPNTGQGPLHSSSQTMASLGSRRSKSPSKFVREGSSSQMSVGSGSSSRSGSTLAKEDLRKALLSVMEKKEELEQQVKYLRASLEQEVSGSQDLKQNLNMSEQRRTEQVEKLESRISILGRENELLKHQLKKYVGAVQKLRDGPQAYETLAQLESRNETKEILGKYVDYHFEASEYEKKLIQVAEMHGELLEFNETLQRSVQSRDAVISRLRAELVLLRGPLPEDDDGGGGQSSGADTVSLGSASDFSSHGGGGGGGRVLVNIWIPSVFLTGTGSDRHHVYQVYVRIRDTEWNIYKRYSQFLELHHSIRKSDPIVTSFHFPPKKTVGHRSEKFVENRRKLLQAYLRTIVNYLVTTHASLSSCPDKETLVNILPFFSDAPPLRQEPTRPSIFRRRDRTESQPHLVL